MVLNYKLYKIVCNKTGNFYYGNTKKTLKERLKKHEDLYKESCICNSCCIIKNNDYNIFLIRDKISDKKTARYIEDQFI